MEAAELVEAAERPAPVWFLSFDCATKTFAFSLSRIDKAAILAASARAAARGRAALEVTKRVSDLLAAGRNPEAAALLGAVSPRIAALDAETARLIQIEDGATVDLAPGREDKKVQPIERVRAVTRYVAERVRPALAAIPAGETLRVVIEFQMGPNSPARVVAVALMTLFAAEDVCLVGPTLKNLVAVGPGGAYGLFAERYGSAYGANKAHAMYNFDAIEAVFGSKVPVTRPPSLRGHIADSFMQVLGHLRYDDPSHVYTPGQVFYVPLSLAAKRAPAKRPAAKRPAAGKGGPAAGRGLRAP